MKTDAVLAKMEATFSGIKTFELINIIEAGSFIFKKNHSLRKNHEKCFCIWWLGVSDQRIIACCEICDILEFTIIISMIKMCFSIIASIIKGWHSCQFFEIWIRETICLFSNSTRGTNIVDLEGKVLNFKVSRLLENDILKKCTRDLTL